MTQALGKQKKMAKLKRRGNPNWGKQPTFMEPVVPTEFEVTCKQLGLRSEEEMQLSPELKKWGYRHLNNRYIPEWLLKHWGFDVDIRLTSLDQDTIKRQNIQDQLNGIVN